MLAEFEILGLIGVGGFGMVYQAYDHSLQRTVAIKEYMPAAIVGRAGGTSVTLRSAVDQSSFSSGLKSFVAEARLLAQFDHPSLVKVHRFWEANNTAYMAMPLYVGLTLKQARSQMQGPPPETWLRHVLWPVLNALKVLHASNTVHRDVSPDNIFLQDAGPPVLLDLGSARRAVLDSSQKHTAILKVNYAPIEQYADAVDFEQGPWTDLYSVAAVVHGCLCNEPPPPATFRVLRDRMPSIASVATTVEEHFGQSYSAEFVAAMDHALAVRPLARPQSVDSMIAEMGLTRPDDMLTFDWRAGLVKPVTLSGGRAVELAQPVESPTRVIHEELTRNDTVNAGGSVPRRRWMTIALMVLIMGLAASGWFFVNGPSQLPPADAGIVPGIAQNPISSAIPPSSDAPSGASMTQVAPPALPVRVAKPATALTSTKPVPLASRASQPVREPPQAVALCADSNFLTRSMCMYRECQKPGFAALKVCVEARNRYADNQDRTNP